MHPETAAALIFRAEVLLQRLAIIKDTPSIVRGAEDKLWNDLRKPLADAELKLLVELSGEEYIEGAISHELNLMRYLRELEEPFAETITEHAMRAMDAAREDLFNILKPRLGLVDEDAPAVIGEADSQGTDGGETGGGGSGSSAPGGQAGASPARGSVTVHFDGFPQETRDLLYERIFAASVSTVDRLVGDVMASLTESYEEGLGVKEAARRLEDVFRDMEEYELRRIARTEIIGAVNEGTYLYQQELGVEYHEWVAASDDRTRESHAELDGVIVRVGDRFPNGLLYPGDRDGDIEEWINCRCRTVPYLMPEGMIPPPDLAWFRESDLIEVRAAKREPEEAA